MHKKLEGDLTSLAHSILQMKNKEDVFALKEKAHEVYEKLSVLAYVEEYINNTPNPEHDREGLIETVENIFEELEKKAADKQAKEHEAKESLFKMFIAEENNKEPREEVIESAAKEAVVKHNLEDVVEEDVPKESTEEVKEEEKSIELVEEKVEESIEVEAEVESEVEFKPEAVAEEQEETIELEIEQDLFTAESEETTEENKVPTLEEELQDTIAVDVVADLFENAPKKSLNDKLQGDIQIGLNDRIAFVKNLFDGSQEDFNRVVSQLNTFKTEKEAKKFINKMVRPDYDWTEKEEFEERFIAIIERKFA